MTLQGFVDPCFIFDTPPQVLYVFLPLTNLSAGFVFTTIIAQLVHIILVLGFRWTANQSNGTLP